MYITSRTFSQSQTIYAYMHLRIVFVLSASLLPHATQTGHLSERYVCLFFSVSNKQIRIHINTLTHTLTPTNHLCIPVSAYRLPASVSRRPHAAQITLFQIRLYCACVCACVVHQLLLLHIVAAAVQLPCGLCYEPVCACICKRVCVYLCMCVFKNACVCVCVCKLLCVSDLCTSGL